MKLHPISSPVAIILSASMLCGVALFIYQDFKADFDKCQQDQSKAYQDEMDAIKPQIETLNETLKDQASAIIYFESKQIAEDQQKKIQAGLGFAKQPSPETVSIETLNEIKTVNDELEGIADDLDDISTAQKALALDSALRR